MSADPNPDTVDRMLALFDRLDFNVVEAEHVQHLSSVIPELRGTTRLKVYAAQVYSAALMLDQASATEAVLPLDWIMTLPEIAGCLRESADLIERAAKARVQ